MTTATKKEKSEKKAPATREMDDKAKEAAREREPIEEEAEKREKREGEGANPERTPGERAEAELAEKVERTALVNDALEAMGRHLGLGTAQYYAEGVAEEDVFCTWVQIPFEAYYWITRVDGDAGRHLFLAYENDYRETWSKLGPDGEAAAAGGRNPIPVVLGEFYGTRASTSRGRFLVEKSYFESKINWKAVEAKAMAKVEEARRRAQARQQS